jgi:hypothetical protein
MSHTPDKLLKGPAKQEAPRQRLPRPEPAAERLLLDGYGKVVSVLAVILGAPVTLGVKLLSLLWRCK